MKVIAVVASLLLGCALNFSVGRKPFRQQEKDGKYFAFEDDNQYHLENWTVEGVATGFFGWTDPTGNELGIEFIADDRGYRVIKKRRELPRPDVKDPHSREEFDEYEFDEDDDQQGYRFAYNTGTAFREEMKRGGVIFGKYGYIDAKDRLHVVHYTASKKRGFIPIRQVRPRSDYRAAVDEPITPVPLRRLRSTAAPPDLLPAEDNIPSVVQTTPATFSTQTVRSRFQVVATTPAAVRSPNALRDVSEEITSPPLELQRSPLRGRPGRDSASDPQGSHLQFKYNIGPQFHRQDQLNDGRVAGQYGWKDARGIIRVVHYEAGDDGYKVVNRAQNLPTDNGKTEI